MSILKRQVSSSSIFVSFFTVMTHNFSLNFKLIHFLLWTIGSHQSSNSDTFKCSAENLPNSSCHFPSNKSVLLQILHHSSMPSGITPLYFFRSNNIYFVQKESIKVNFLRLSSAQVKICQIPYVSFETTKVNSSPNFVSLFSFMKDKFYVLFSSNNIYFAQKEPIKVKIFETFECPGQNLSNSLCQF